MADPRVHDIRGLDLAVRDLGECEAFYSKLWGLEVVERDRGSVYLRATGTEHHALALHEAPKIEVLGARYAAPDRVTVDALHAKAVAAGADVIDAPHALPAIAGGGYGFDVRTPDGIRHTISSDVQRHVATIDDKRRPRKFSHVVFRSKDYPQLETFLRDIMGFKLSDRTDGIDFFRCSGDHHSVALGKLPGSGLHHMAFELPDLDGLMGASGRMKLSGHRIEWGVGRHAGPGNNIFSVFVDPNGIAAEYTTEMEQVDDATYPHRTIEDWRDMPIRPCAWGMGMERSERLRQANTGKLVEDLNRGCDEAIARKLAS
jgi:catechol 2,3-dioxygenase